MGKRGLFIGAGCGALLCFLFWAAVLCFGGSGSLQGVLTRIPIFLLGGSLGGYLASFKKRRWIVITKYSFVYIIKFSVKYCLHNFDKLHNLVVFMQSLLHYADFCIIIKIDSLQLYGKKNFVLFLLPSTYTDYIRYKSYISS